jgi:hypothetical protein
MVSSRIAITTTISAALTTTASTAVAAVLAEKEQFLQI